MGFLDLLFIFAIVFAVLGLRVVRQQTVAVVETFGRFSRTLSPGLNWIVPVVQTVAARMDLRVQEIKSSVEVKSVDNVFVTLPVAIMVRVEEDSAADAYYKLSNAREQVKTWVLNTLRSSTSNMKLSELFEDRVKLEGAVKEQLAKRMGDYGYVIVGVLVDQPSVSEIVQASFNRVVSSQREKEAAEQEAEAKRIRVVGEAKAEAESQKLRAEGLASARKILSQSLTEAVLQAKQGGIPEKEIMYLLLETNRLDTVKYASEHGKLVVMDVRNPSGASLQLPTD
jgi:regulator of protease activity HflC (stomatin/prohibitin superfamily)